MVRLPHPLILLLAGVIAAAALTWILPAGVYDRRDDPVTGRRVAVAGTYHGVARAPVGPFGAAVAVPRGFVAGADVIAVVLFVGGAWVVVDRLGTLPALVALLVARFRRRGLWAIPVISLFFATMGALENMQEEIIPLVPVLLLLTTRLGFDPLVAAAVSVGAAGVGASFSPIDPFQVGIAQKLAGLPLLSASGYRLVFLALALALWIAATIRYARRTRTASQDSRAEVVEEVNARDGVVLGLVIVTFAIFIVGVMKFGWDFDQMSALFFIMGVIAGTIGGLGVTGTAEAFVEGFRSMAFAGLLIGFARAIFVVAEQGQIIDTMVNGLFAPLSHLPVGIAAAGMIVVHFLVHFPVPSVSGQAVLTMPVLVPLSDLLGLSRQVTVLAFQYGGGMADIVVPTNGALMAILAASGVPYGKWIRFITPIYAALFLLGLVAVGIAIVIRLA